MIRCDSNKMMVRTFQRYEGVICRVFGKKKEERNVK